MALLALLLIAAGVAAAAAAAPTDALWPLPWKISAGAQVTALDRHFAFVVTSSSNSVLEDAVRRYMQLLDLQQPASGLASCSISIADAHVPNEVINSDESYSLNVDVDSCSLTAATTWGALRGLETFSQLLTRQNGLVLANNLPVAIDDKPRYGHRGLLIDTARHFIPVDEIKRVIDSLPANKMNVLHWHAIDAESFPLDTPSEPTMVKGAFSPSMIYSMADVSDVVAYAFARGVEVIMELDMPGHAAGWIPGKPEVMADCLVKYSYNINDFALNPALDETYVTIQNILSDVTHAANSYKVHLGGDEVVYGCWHNDTSVGTYMKTNGIKSDDAMLAAFVKRVDSNALGTSHQLNAVIHWEEVYKANAWPNRETTIFQVWTDSSMVLAITNSSYRVIASPSNYWYLNLAANTWQVMYGYDPVVGLSDAQAAYVVGGEAALWGELVDASNLEASVFPRAAAVAERLWSDPAQTASVTSATTRLLSQRCRLVNRGVQAAPVQPGGYCATVLV